MSTDAPPEEDIGSISSLASQATVARYFAGIALTLCVYDWLILIERESQTAWKTRWTRTKAIYYINRVISLIGLTITVIQTTDLWREPLSQRFCKFYIWFAPMLQLLSFYLGNIILTLRVVALYSRRLVVTRILYVLLVLNWILTLVPTVHSLYLWSLGINYEPPLHACVSPVYSPSSPVIFFVPAVFEGTLFAFTLYRAIHDFRNRVLTDFPNLQFLTVLYRDGFYYFAAVGAVHGWNSLEYLLSPTSGMFMGVYFAWAVMTVMSSRVYLNLVLVVHGGRGRDGMTTGGLSTFRTARVDNSEGIEREAGHIETFGAKHIHRRIPLTTFTTTALSVEYNARPDAEPDSLWSEGGKGTVVEEGNMVSDREDT